MNNPANVSGRVGRKQGDCDKGVLIEWGIIRESSLLCSAIGNININFNGRPACARHMREPRVKCSHRVNRFGRMKLASCTAVVLKLCEKGPR
jgi:hypothetical protein